MTPDRPGHDTLVARLTPWLLDRLVEDHGHGVDEVSLHDVARPVVGQSSDLWTYRLTWQLRGRQHEARQVVRREPAPDGIFLRPDVLREAAILRGLAGSSVPVPSVRWTEQSGRVLDRPFFVMDLVPGRVPGAKPSIHSTGWLTGLSPTERRTLWDNAMDALVGVHQVRWEDDLGFLAPAGDATGAGAHLRRLTAWYRWAARERSFAIPDVALRWLQDNVSRAGGGPDALVWGDARVGNMIFGPDGTVEAVLDWEVASIGPREIDVAHWLVFDELATDAVGVTRLEGLPGRDESIDTYEERSGHALASLAFFEVQQAFFLATTLIRQADRRVAKGELEPGTRMAHENAATILLARRLGLEVPELSADYQRHRGGS
ncbi:phosphotransferase family protein [Arsenicicoccus bolidensis]|uniref:phosphotransferase family protein n=1 Tax=Arsenicicoccus bolidensis TaxID=229480 RepID=UPI0028ACF9B0|nr:phosphotransferase family protein [Arsenicicoccus bolidensis]